MLGSVPKKEKLLYKTFLLQPRCSSVILHTCNFMYKIKWHDWLN